MLLSYGLALSLVLVALAALNSSHAQKTSPTQDSLLEVVKSTHSRPAKEVPAELKLISYNIRWRGGEDLRKMIELFKTDPGIGGAAILGLQEVDRNKQRTHNSNTARMIANELGMNYAWTAPPAPKVNQEEETGVAILSIYPLSHIQRIVLPYEGPGHRRRVALGATVTIGNQSIRYYSVHSENRVAVDQKIEQLQAVIDDLSHYPKEMPAVILGDFNTWEASAVTRTRKLFTGSGFDTPFDDRSTFSRNIVLFPLELKLDWIWLRNLGVVSNGVQRDISLSDHWPMWCVVRLKTKA